MTHSNTPTVSGDLMDLLERERVLILSGEIEQIVRLLPEKERLLTALNSTDQSQQSLKILQVEADRNQVLLGAVAQGIRTVQKRLSALHASGSELRTYTQAGHAENLANQRTNIERKA